MKHRLFGLRGKAYVAEYKRLYEELQDSIIQDFKEILSTNDNKFTPINLGQLAIKHRLPVKVLDEFLAGYPIPYHTGTWEKLQDRGLKAKDIGVVWSASTLSTRES